MSDKKNKKKKRNRILVWGALIVMVGSIVISLIVSLFNFI